MEERLPKVRRVKRENTHKSPRLPHVTPTENERE